MSKKEISFTEGPVFQSLLRFAIPVLGALILQAAYGAVDLLIVGKFGNASRRDHWMTAQEALDFGLIDKIITSKK